MADVIYYGIGGLMAGIGLIGTAVYLRDEFRKDLQWHRVMVANRTGHEDIDRRGSRRRHPTAHRAL